jgi:hypothetical protein
LGPTAKEDALSPKLGGIRLPPEPTGKAKLLDCAAITWKNSSRKIESWRRSCKSTIADDGSDGHGIKAG